MTVKKPQTPDDSTPPSTQPRHEQRREKSGGAATFIGDVRSGGSAAGADLEPRRDAPRTATDMAPGIPVGSGEGIDKALEQPDTEIGGGVAGDTSVGGESAAGNAPDRNEVRNEDKGRNTL